MSDTIFASNNPARRAEGILSARIAVGRGEVVCIPTDTRYALVVDAFKVPALEKLRAVRNMPAGAGLSVLVPGIPILSALAAEVSPEVLLLAEAFWPGALTLIVRAGDSIAWDLGATGGTVALRMPADRVAAELLSETGPLAHSGAFRVGEKPLTSLPAIAKRFESDISVYLSAAEVKPGKTLSTVVDATSLGNPGGKLILAREGALSLAKMHEVVPPESWA